MDMIFSVFVAFCFVIDVGAVNTTEIVFGQSAPLSGTLSYLGLQMKAGIETAFNEFNAKNDSKIPRLRLVSYDDMYQSATASANTARLIHNDTVFGLIGNVGIVSATAGVEGTRKLTLPMIGALSGSRELRWPYNPNVINVRPGDREELAAIVNLVVGEYRMNRIACVYQNDNYGRWGVMDLEFLLDEVEIDLVAIGTYSYETQDIDAAFLNVTKAGSIDCVIFLGTAAPTSKFIQKARSHPSFSKDSFYVSVSFVGAEELLQAMGTDDLTNIYVSQTVPLASNTQYEVVRNFLRAVRYEANSAALEGYIVGRFTIEVLLRMKSFSPEEFIRTVQTMQWFGVDDLRYGLYGGPCPATTKLNLQTVCNCSQGGKTVWMARLNPKSRALEEVADARFQLPNTECYAMPSVLRESTAYGIIYPTDGSIANHVGHHRGLGVKMAFDGARARGADIDLQLVVGEDVSTTPSSLRQFIRKNRLVGLISSVIDYGPMGYDEFLLIDPYDPDPAAAIPLPQIPKSTFFTTPTLEDEIYALVGAMFSLQPNATLHAIFRTTDPVFDNSTKSLLKYWLWNSLDTHSNGTVNTTGSLQFLGSSDDIPTYPSEGYVLLVTATHSDLDPLLKNSSTVSKLTIMLPAWAATAHMSCLPNYIQSRIMSVSVSDDTVRSVRGGLIGKLRLEFIEDALRSSLSFDLWSDPIIMRGYVAGRLATLLIEHSSNRSATGEDMKTLITTVFTVGVIGHVRLGPYGEPCASGNAEICPCPAGAHSLYVYFMSSPKPVYFTHKTSCNLPYRSSSDTTKAAPATDPPSGLAAYLPQDTTTRYEVISGFFAAILILVSLIGCFLYRRNRKQKEERGDF